MKNFILFIFVLFISFSYAQELNGNYTIGVGGDFISLSSATNALNERGVNGAVTFNVISGIYDEHFVIDFIPGASEENTITFQSQARDSSQVIIRYTADNADSNYVIKLKSSSYVTIRDMTFEVGGARYSNAMVIENYALNCTINNNAFKGYYDTNGWESETLIAAYITTANSLKDIHIINNYFLKGAYGVHIHSMDNNSISSNITLSGNTLDSLGHEAINISFSNHLEIDHNEFRHCGTGIEIYNISNAIHIYNNILSDFKNYGMILSNCTAIEDDPSYVFNNMVSGNTTASYGVMIRFSCTNLNFFNNSIRINNTYYESKALSVSGATGTGIRLLNNVITSMQKGTALYVEQPSVVRQCDYNAYYSSGRFLAYWGKDCEDLRTLKALSGDNAHSLLAYPNFVSDSDLHVNSAWLDGVGTNEVGITEDIDGQSRSNPPDMGADEFTATADVQPPLSGTRTVGAGQDYNTMNEAINDIQIKGISDSLKLVISPGVYNEQCVIPSITGASSAHPLIIESYGANAENVTFRREAAGRDDDYIFNLQGASFIKIRHLSFESPNMRYSRILLIEGMADSLYVGNCNFIGGAGQTNSLEECALINEKDANFHCQVIDGNYFQYGAFSIKAENQFEMSQPGKITVKNNRCEEVGYEAFDFYKVRYLAIIKNHIESQAFGINIYKASTGLNVSANYILTQDNQALKLNQCVLPLNNEHVIYNNFLISGPVYNALLDINFCDTLNMYYNNVSMESNLNDRYPVKIQSSHAVDMRNNIFFNKGVGYAVYVANTDFLQADYNDYYTNGTNMGLGYWDQLCPDLDDIRSASGMNEHSINRNPIFTSDSDLHVSSSYLNEAAQPVDGITEDFDGDLRHPITPDIGADEFNTGTQNQPYRIAQISDQVFDEDCATQLIVADLHTIFTDDADDYLTFSAFSSEPNIQSVIQDSSLSITVTPNFNGSNKQIIVKASDLARQAAYDTFLVTITPVPDRPQAVDDHVSMLLGNDLDIYPLENDNDPDGLKLSVFHIDAAHHGTAQIVNDSTLNYVPQTGFTGADSFKYVAGNTAQLLDTATVFIEITDIFSMTDSQFTGVSNGGALWGDYDNDKDLDLLVFGLINNSNENVNVIYRNTDGVFTPNSLLQGTALAPDNPQGAAWGDVDNDGDLDLLIAGKVSGDPFQIETRLYINQSGGYFVVYQTDIFDAWAASITWVDYDNDGDQDVLIAGNKSADLYDPQTKLYRNDGKGDGNSWIFSDVSEEQFPDVCYASAAWIDYDKDGDQDLLLCGALDNSTNMMDIFRNDNGNFTRLNLSLSPINYGRIVWGDYDGDGDADILFSGKGSNLFNPRCGIYRNDGNDNFTLQHLPEASVGGDAAWIDWDNDGDLDIALCGRDSLAGKQFKLYNNDSGVYSETETGIPNLTGAMAWGDYDNDGKADICISGMNQAGKRQTVLMKNNTLISNLPPQIPIFAGHSYYYHQIGIFWKAPQDDHTPSQSLTYNIMVGEIEGGYDIVSPSAHPDNGYRKIVFMGNVGQDTSYIIKGLTNGKLYYFAVQAIDGAYSASPFLSKGVTVYADDFMEIEQSLPNIAGKLAQSDINKDKKMDLLLYGNTDKYSYLSGVYQKEAFDYSEKGYTIRKAKDGSVQWRDYDGDGDADLLLNGFDMSDNLSYFSEIAEFQNEQFNEHSYGFSGVFQGDAGWGDYDNDGDEDVLIIGRNSSIPLTKLYENRDSVFVEIATDIHGFSNGSIDWGDYDADGDLDILLTGKCEEVAPLYYASEIYRNDNGVFHLLDADLPPLNYGKGIWGDYDADGDLDVLLCGLSFDGENWLPITKIYVNNAGVFSVSEDSLIGIEKGSVKWVDLDNDGFLDIIGNGLTNDPTGNPIYYYPTTICYIFKTAMPQPGGHYKHLDTWLGEFYNGDIAIGDIDGDLDVDIVQCGMNNNGDYKTRVFRNRVQTANFAPDAPQNLQVTETDSSYIFSWDKASDDKTPQKGLTYNLRLGSASGASDIKPCNSDTNGYHFTPIFGNVGEVTSWELKNPPASGNIYWSVQTIDNNFVGSHFAPEQHITITTIKNTTNAVPQQFALAQNYPNPFNPSTTIKYQLAETRPVELSVYNVLGEKVAVLVNKKQQPGRYSVRFDASKYSSGVYFYRIKAGRFMQIRKMVFLR